MTGSYDRCFFFKKPTCEQKELEYKKRSLINYFAFRTRIRIMYRELNTVQKLT